jgi:hypothetical protein
MDSVAKDNTRLYIDAFQRLAAMYAGAGDQERAGRMLNMASGISRAIK